eukprot:CAMPEP_0119145084 /NCGR_PEP_ID=MMETSP1310-20130426/36991_1 /TAXON_ID=464262 /ORGANISM="Genus nov. species nov., Strain RCC2339" /LENGTH=68 /DNA_ID=CAMNT_0007136875 /DNA_START=73 /DNA_END=276 /DNA_ORIENTATION=+
MLAPSSSRRRDTSGRRWGFRERQSRSSPRTPCGRSSSTAKRRPFSYTISTKRLRSPSEEDAAASAGLS